MLATSNSELNNWEALIFWGGKRFGKPAGGGVRPAVGDADDILKVYLGRLIDQSLAGMSFQMKSDSIVIPTFVSTFAD